MKKTILTVFLVLLMVLPVSAQSAQRATKASPNISFSGTIATCSVSVYCDSTNDRISLTAKLYQDNECIATWTDSGSGKLRFSQTQGVRKGKTYKLTADIAINGSAINTVSTTGTCP